MDKINRQLLASSEEADGVNMNEEPKDIKHDDRALIKKRARADLHAARKKAKKQTQKEEGRGNEATPVESAAHEAEPGEECDSKRSSAAARDLTAHIHACCVDTAFKLYKDGGAKWREIAQRPEVKAIRESKAFKDHRRCEPNYGLDSGDAAQLFHSRGAETGSAPWTPGGCEG